MNRRPPRSTRTDTLFPDTTLSALFAPRPMASAPRDGTKFWGLVGDDAITMFWHPGFGEFVSAFRRMELAAGLTFDDGETFRDHSPVIHKPHGWLPKPADRKSTPLNSSH